MNAPVDSAADASAGSCDAGPPQLITVVDTEEEFDWKRPFDRASIGISHLGRIGDLQAVFDAQGIRPVYAIDYAVASQPAAVAALGPIIADGRALIGAHLHPWVTPPFVEDVTRRNSYPGNLPLTVERDKLAALRDGITAAFAQRPTIYSAGRYGIGANTFDLLDALGFDIDISPMPSFDYRHDEGPDFSRHALQPSWVGSARRVLCIPNTSALVGSLPRRNLHGLARIAMQARWQRLRLPAVLSRLGLVERIALSPEGYTLAEMRRLTLALFETGHRLFTLRLHSPSVAPGHTPYVNDEDDRRALLSKIGRYIDFFRRDLNGAATDPLAIRDALRCGVTPQAPAPSSTAAPPRAKRPRITVTPMRDADLPEAAAYWNRHLNPGIPCDTWIDAFRHPWMPDKPNNGFLLRADGRLVGAIGAIYSRQCLGGTQHDFCNITSLIVEPAYRARAMDLLSALLGQKGLCFTDFTPTPSVAKMLRLLRFVELPSGDYIVPHLPVPAATSGVRAIEDAGELSRCLTGHAARLWRDHRSIPWLKRLAVGEGNRWCLVFWKPTVIKGMPGADLLAISDGALAQPWQQAIGGHLLLHHGLLASRVDAQIWSKVGGPALPRPVTMPHLVRAAGPLPLEQVSFLYSELAALPI